MRRLIFSSVLLFALLLGKRTAYAQDCGVLWQWSNPKPTERSLLGVAYGAGRFVTIGANGLILSSTEGLNWDQETYPYTGWNYMSDVAFGNGQFVIVGNSYNVFTSPDGLAWTYCPGNYYPLNSVCYGVSSFVAVGQQGTIVTSADGTSWTPRASGTTYNLDRVAYGHGKFVAVGDQGTVLTSTDSVSWTSVSPALTTNTLLGLCFGGNLGAEQFVANAWGAAYTSPDGLKWTSHPCELPYPLIRICFANGLYVGVGAGGEIATSLDGASWDLMPKLVTSDLFGLCYGDGHFVAEGSQGALVSSPDGISWSLVSSSVTSGILNNIAWNGSLAVAVGDGIITSPNGIDWSSQDSGATTNLLFGVAYGNGTWVACGAMGVVLTSADGINWVSRNSGTTANLRGVSYCRDRFIAVGDLGLILASPDGQVWSPQISGTSEQLNDAAYGAGLYVAVGRFGTITTSPDGLHWTAQTPPNFSTDFYHITYGGGMFVASGFYMAISSNGLTWTPIYSWTTGAVAYLDGMYVGVDAWGGTITSPDARTWNYCGGIYDGEGFSQVIAAGNQFLAVGVGGLVLHSMPLPMVSSVSPESGGVAGGTSVTISGSGFTGATEVRFGTAVAGNLAVQSDTRLTVTSPPVAHGGIATVTVAGPSGRGVPGQAGFTYYGTPIITSLDPDEAPTTGISRVNLAGKNFTKAISVSFGDQASSSVTVNSDSSITAWCPPAPRGQVNVVVTTPGGTSETSSATKFTYFPPPAISSVAALANPFRLKIKGSGFTKGSQIYINFQAVLRSVFKNADLLLAKGGASLEAMLPDGVPVQIVVENRDNGAVSAPFTYTP